MIRSEAGGKQYITYFSPFSPDLIASKAYTTSLFNELVGKDFQLISKDMVQVKVEEHEQKLAGPPKKLVFSATEITKFGGTLSEAEDSWIIKFKNSDRMSTFYDALLDFFARQNIDVNLDLIDSDWDELTIKIPISSLTSRLTDHSNINSP